MLYPRSSVPLLVLATYLAAATAAATGVATVASCATAGSASDDDDDGNRTVDAAPRPMIDAAPAADATPAADAAPIDAPPSAVDCSEDTTIACGELLEHSLFFADGTVTGYSCETEDTTGVENIYKFVPAATGAVTINLDVLEDQVLIGDDFDLYVLEDVCGTASCATQSAAAGDESLTFTATGGTTYYIVVEAFAIGLITFQNYDLGITCL